MAADNQPVHEAPVAQWIARLPPEQKVRGSSPLGRISVAPGGGPMAHGPRRLPRLSFGSLIIALSKSLPPETPIANVVALVEEFIALGSV